MRLPGWERRLEAVVDACRDRPYQLGQADCLRFACEAIAALTGRDHWSLFEGRYHSKAGALRLLAKWGRSWRHAGEAFFGAEPVPPALARRGDILTFDDGREKHLGVCVGATVALYGDVGLVFVPVTDDRLVECWRVD